MNYSQMSPEDKVHAAEVMYGAGSKQHLAAVHRFTPWRYRISHVVDGLVPEVDITATRSDGTMLVVTAYKFPAGWRINAPRVPAVVRREALRMAKESGF